jgi:RHS repeat-associated protein
MYDGTSPEITLVNLEPQFVPPGHSLMITATVVDAASQVQLVQASIDDFTQTGQIRTLDLLPAGSDDYAAGLDVESGTLESQKSITVTAWDAANNAATPVNAGLYVDGTPPVLAAPVLSLVGATDLFISGSTLYYGPTSSGQLEVSIQATDNVAGLQTLTFPPIFGTDGHQESWTDGPTNVTGSHSYPVISSQSVISNYVLSATDRAGNTGVSAPFRVERDAAAPALTNLILTGGGNPDNVYATGHTFYYSANATGGTLEVSLEVADPLAGVDLVTFPTLFGDSPDTDLNGDNGPTPVNYTYTVNAGQTVNDTFEVTVADTVGNESSVSFTVARDTTPPDISLPVPDTIPLPYSLSWQATDDLAGIRSYQVQYRQVGAPTWSDLAADTADTSVPFVDGVQGESYEFQVRATDNVNNQSAWVGAGPVLVSGAAVKKYYHFGGQRIAMRQGAEVYYLHGDHLGSTSLTTNSAGIVQSESRYLPYGQVRWQDGASVTDFGFTSQRREGGFGLYDYNARYYSHILGRFVSADSIVPRSGNPQSLNRYSYVLNRPLC